MEAECFPAGPSIKMGGDVQDRQTLHHSLNLGKRKKGAEAVSRRSKRSTYWNLSEEKTPKTNYHSFAILYRSNNLERTTWLDAENYPNEMVYCISQWQTALPCLYAYA